MFPGILKYRLNRQIIFIFLIIILLLITSVIFTHRTIVTYQKEIKYIDDTSLEQLLQINKILHNAGIRRQTLLIYLFSNDVQKTQRYEDDLLRLQEENRNYFKQLSNAIEKEFLRKYLNDLMVYRETYTSRIKEAMALKKSGQLPDPITYEQLQIASLYKVYIDYLEHLSDMIAANASSEIESTLSDLMQLRRIYIIIIVIGSIALLALIMGVLLIATDLRNDHIRLEKETAERKEAEKKLQLLNEELRIKSFELNRLNEHKDSFISVISHDLRNPLTNIMGSSGFLIEHPDDKEAQRMIDIIYRSSKKMLQQLNDLVIIAKATNSRRLFNPNKVNLYHEVEEGVTLLIDSARNKNIRIDIVIRKDVYVKADKIMLASVLQNLLANAIKYTFRGGMINISSATQGDMEYITIKDNGVGMKREEMEKLFTDKVISKEGTEEEKGTGLGLKLVKIFIEKHNGQVRVESKEGEGTSITFSLPRIAS